MGGSERGVALVTGAGRGIGRSIVDALLTAGFDVAAASLEETPRPSLPTPADGGQRTLYQRFDLADLGAHAALLDRVEGELGPITCLVNNAGVSSLVRGDLLDLTPESFDRAVAVNMRGTFFLTQAVARRMVAREWAGTRSIVTIGSANAEIVGENRGDYCMTKTALGMMTKLFASRLAEAGIGVYEIRPGIIRTEMTAVSAERYEPYIRSGGVPMRRWGLPEDVGAVVATLASGGLPFTTGIHIDVGGGFQLHRV